MAGALDRYVNTKPGMMVKWIFSKFDLAKLRYYKQNPTERRRVELIARIYQEEPGVVLFSPGELLMIYEQAWLQRDHGGAFAEVGVFRGASATAICEAKGTAPLYLFDTFEGLPEAGPLDSRFWKGLFHADEQAVRRRLAKYPEVTIYRGEFPHTAEPIRDLRFSFVHLDVDLYRVTREALEFFYPRLLPGGKILSHDYGQCEGVWRAFDEFISDKPEELMPLELTQVMLVKR